MKSFHASRKELIKQLLLSKSEKNWPTLDELPQADTTDLEKAYQYQSTVDSDFES